MQGENFLWTIAVGEIPRLTLFARDANPCRIDDLKCRWEKVCGLWIRGR